MISELSPDDPAAASSPRIRLPASLATDGDDRDTRSTDCCFVDVPNHEPAPGTTHPLPRGSPICPPRRGTPFASATPPSSGARGRGCSPPPAPVGSWWRPAVAATVSTATCHPSREAPRPTRHLRREAHRSTCHLSREAHSFMHDLSKEVHPNRWAATEAPASATVPPLRAEATLTDAATITNVGTHRA